MSKTFDTEEAGLAILLVSSLDPNAYAHDATRALIYKAKDAAKGKQFRIVQR